jgi:single-strand DNA-binding protein
MQENSIRLAGYLGKDPELKFTPTGTPVVKVKLAESQRYLSKNQQVEHTDWHTLVFWGDLAKFAAAHYLKGDNIAIQGTYRSRKFTPQDGSERTVWEVTVFKSAKLHRDPKNREEPEPNLEARDAREEFPIPENAPLGSYGDSSNWPIH